jgi:hypothetical protein
LGSKRHKRQWEGSPVAGVSKVQSGIVRISQIKGSDVSGVLDVPFGDQRYMVLAVGAAVLILWNSRTPTLAPRSGRFATAACTQRTSGRRRALSLGCWLALSLSLSLSLSLAERRACRPGWSTTSVEWVMRGGYRQEERKRRCRLEEVAGQCYWLAGGLLSGMGGGVTGGGGMGRGWGVWYGMGWASLRFDASVLPARAAPVVRLAPGSWLGGSSISSFSWATRAVYVVRTAPGPAVGMGGILGMMGIMGTLGPLRQSGCRHGI